MQRALNVVRSDPTKLVTALRIIDREEKFAFLHVLSLSLSTCFCVATRFDEKALEREKAVGFLPPGRPKEWQKKCFETLEQATNHRLRIVEVLYVVTITLRLPQI